MMTMGNMLGWHTAGRAAYEANEALVEIIESVLVDTSIPAEIDRYYMRISTFTVNLSTGVVYSSYMAPLHDGDKVEVQHSRPIMNFNRRQARRVRLASEMRANREIVLRLKTDIGLNRPRAVA
jgi:hypothetical protein